MHLVSSQPPRRGAVSIFALLLLAPLGLANAQEAAPEQPFAKSPTASVTSENASASASSASASTEKAPASASSASASTEKAPASASSASASTEKAPASASSASASTENTPASASSASASAENAPASVSSDSAGTENASGDAALLAANTAALPEGDLSPPAPAKDGLSVPPPPAPTAPSQNVTINLINRLVAKGVLSKEDAADLIQQAEADAQLAQARAAATQAAVAQANATAQQAVAQTPPPPEDDGTMRVTYVPAIVKSQISAQVKDEVMAQAKAEGWAAPNLIPSWLPKIRPFADIRVRYEGDLFGDGNDASGAFPNFNAINTGAPFNTAGDQFSPQLNVDQDRYRMRLRARFGADLILGKGFSSGIRIATGQDNAPVSTNQSMGLPYQGQGGNFSKYAIWLDRAFIKYQLGNFPNKQLTLNFGRFDNPFFNTSTIMWDDDIGFDGVALQARYEVWRWFTPFIAGGVFPVYNTDFNYSSNQPQKFKSYDKWLSGGQLGAVFKIGKDIEITGAAAYYYFKNIEGQLSSPYTPLTINDAGDTDASRPSFAQKGNTYMALRDIVPNASNDYGTINQWQYYGLATPFRNLVFSGRIDYKRFEPFVISIMGDWTQNLAFDQGALDANAVNNRGPLDTTLSDSNSVGPYVGGNTAWSIQGQVGMPVMTKFGDWNFFGGYRYVESDAVVDGFTESDFGGGGTNLKGWYLGANLALGPNVWLGGRWMSAESIAGPPFKEDVFQIDLNAKF
jgi:hypothetical protein